MDHLRFKLLQAHNVALMRGQASQFDPSMPWDAVWEAAVTDDKFWENEFRINAMMLVTNGLPQSQVVDGDAEIAGHHTPMNTMPKQKSLNTQPAQTNPRQPGPGTNPEFCKLFQQG